MKKAIVAVVALGAVIGLRRPALRRMRAHATQMAAHCREMAAGCRARAAHAGRHQAAGGA